MSWLALQTVAQISVERVLNALPEGFLIALFAWALLRVLRRQNSGTRFAVWFLALLTVAALPVLAAFGEGRTAMPAAISPGNLRPAITIPGHWALFVFLAWALGVCLAMTRLVAGLWQLRQLRRSCTPVAAADLAPSVQTTLDAMGAAGSGASSAVTIATSECVRVPAAIGFWKRTIVLPAWTLRELPANDLNVILLHEFAHLRRGDDWTNLIQKMVRALFFFHPAVWWIEKQLSVEREMACDDAVLAETGNPHGYATCLVSLLEKSCTQRPANKHWSMAQAAVHRAREAALRLAQILDAKRPMATRVWTPALGIVGVFSLVCLMALPITPQFVAFDRGVAASNSIPAVLAAVRPVAFTGEPDVPARRNGRDARRSPTRPHQLAPVRVVAARVDAALSRQPVVEAIATTDQGIGPQFQTLVFIEARQYGTSNPPVWSVQVWRLTFVSAVREQNARVWVVKSI